MVMLLTYHEGGDEGDNATICVETIGNSTHTVLTNTEPDVSTLVAAETGALRLEVNHRLGPCQVGTRQVSRAADELGKDGYNGGEDDLRKLAGSLGGVRRLIDRQRLLPVVRKLSSNATGELGVLGGVLLGIGRKEVVPLCLELSTTGGDSTVGVIRLLRDVEGLVSRKTELALEGLNVVSLQSWQTADISQS